MINSRCIFCLRVKGLGGRQTDGQTDGLTDGQCHYNRRSLCRCEDCGTPDNYWTQMHKL